MESVAQDIFKPQPNRRGKRIKETCHNCGRLFLFLANNRRTHQTHAYCCAECGLDYKQKTASPNIPYRECLFCRKQILRNSGGRSRLDIRKGDTGKYCSKRCCGDHKIAMNKQKATMFLDVATLLVWDYRRTTLNIAVRKINSSFKKAQKAKIRNANKLLKIDRRVINVCVRCGCQFNTTKVCVKTCKRCSAMVYKKQQRHHKRCEAKGLPYDKSVTMEFIGERADWKCEICGKQCLKHFKWLPVGDNLYGKVHGMSPTQDHIVPLNHPDNWTHGHTAENTQLACHQCNSVDKNMDTTQTMINSSHPRAELGLPPDGVVDQYQVSVA